jgi:hypothetical protein
MDVRLGYLLRLCINRMLVVGEWRMEKARGRRNLREGSLAEIGEPALRLLSGRDPFHGFGRIIAESVGSPLDVARGVSVDFMAAV